ncbi:MAG: DNA methylase N-4/N-6 domain-containing protein [Ignavibacteria bacterium]|nr:MAG: DNA methylase N-4/N-6 domain-containing protein [Ignavibacteria bacterium]KAF0157781.1 MAG: DNA methylase N-4/N-6 domain-containing protein [Ignavibacteria bacterium]
MKIENETLSNFKEEITTAWSFPERGNWATHNPKYRGNFAPQIPRNLILKYSNEGDFILDPMVGAGTTLIEAKLLHRNADGLDINPEAVAITNNALEFEYETKSKQNVYAGDTRNLSRYKNNSIDLIITHPPYLNIVQYSKNTIEEDLSSIGSIPKFFKEMKIIADEMFRVIKENHHCAILIGDTRKAQHYVPLSYYLLQTFLKAGFVLKEEIIKAQHNCIYSKKWVGSAAKYNFYLIMHEHLFVFRKPKSDENKSRVKYSTYNGMFAEEE